MNLLKNPSAEALTSLAEGLCLPSTVGRYAIKRLLGRGSFANVVLAWDEELESAVALKILHARNAETERRFLEEARMLRRVQSLNVIAVHDIGRLDDATPYFVLDFATRGTLENRLASGVNSTLLDTASQVQLLNLVDGLADGLLAIHQAGMVHRDIKPANILFCGGRSAENDRFVCSESFGRQPSKFHDQLLGKGERVLVGDLGIAKDLSKHSRNSALLGGTPFYLAPEQRIPGVPVTPAADIYSSTALLWRTLINETPPAAEELEARLATLPKYYSQQDWQSFFRKGLSPAPENRHQTADEWRWSVHEVLGSGASTVVYPPHPGQVTGPRTDFCPYKGLAAYEAGDASFFRGRDALVHQLCRRLQLESVLVVGGPSGSGKSSLIRAGLLPSLKAGASPGSEHWQSLLMTPGPQPVQALQQCLEPCGGLDNLLQQIESVSWQGPTTVLVIDQFEEIFTVASEANRKEFLETLAQLSGVGATSVKLILAVRADFYAECAREPWLAARITSNQVLVGPMTSSELRQAITEPAREAGYVLEKGLVSAIIEEAGNESGSLPLVAHALVETWARRVDNTLTLEGFLDSGGVAGAISQSADATYDLQLDDLGREATRRLMLSLVNPGDGSPDTRRVINREDIASLTDQASDSSAVADVIKKLTDARLLTVDETKVQITHEALLRNWPRLRLWIDESRDDLRMRRRISLRAEEWQAAGRESDLLYHGAPLYASLEWRQENNDHLGVLENSFLDHSKNQQTEIEQKAANGRRRARRLWIAVVALLTVLALGATLSSIFAFRAFRDSQQHALIAEESMVQANYRFAGALGAAAYGHHEEDPRLSLVLASEALVRSDVGDSNTASTFDTRAAMVSARQVLAEGGPFLLGSPIVAGDAMSIALNPQGSVLTIGNLDGRIQFLDVATHQPLQPDVQNHIGGVRDIEFSPNGQSMISAGADGRILLWKPDSHGVWMSLVLGETGDVIPDVDFHPTGDYIVSANHNATIGFWPIGQHPTPQHVFSSGVADFNAVALSADGRFMVAGDADKTISGWNIESGELIMGPLDNIHSSHLLDIVFDPSANSFFTMTTDGESKRLSFPEGRVLETLFEANETIGAMLFSASTNELLAGTNSGRLASWDISSNSVDNRSASGHSQIIKRATKTLDDRLVATLGRDQLVRFWTNNDDYAMGQQLQVDAPSAKSVAISPNGNLMASGDSDGNLKLWQLNANDAPENIAGHDAQIWALAFSPDSNLLASGDRQGRVQVWDIEQHRIVQMLDTGEAAIWSLEFIDTRELLVATDTLVSSYEIAEGNASVTRLESQSSITRLSMSPDKQQLVVSQADGTVIVEKLSGEPQTRVINVGDDLIWSAALNHSGSMLAAASSDETVSLIDVASGNRVAKLTGHRGGATNVAFLDDGMTLVVSDRRGSIHWWDIPTARRLAAPWRGHRKAVWRLHVHPDGNRFATAGDDGKVWMWDTLSVKQACKIGYPGFDTGQKKQYLGDDHQMQACQ